MPSYGNYIDFSSVKKVLIVKLRHHGDVLLSSPVFATLKNHFPHLVLDALLYADTLPMLEGHPAINTFFTYDKRWKEEGRLKRLLREISLYKRLRKERYDLVINLTEGDRGALIALFSLAKYRVGIDPGKEGFLGKRKIYTHLVKKVQKERHAVERDLDALRKIGLFAEKKDKELFLQIPEGAKKSIETTLQEEGIKKEKLIVIHPVSRWRFKCPPPSWFVKLIVELEKRGYQIVLSASQDTAEIEMVEKILSALKGSKTLSLAAKTSLKELFALIASASYLITVDSVPLHIASALKTPVIALFGPTSDRNWGPWNHPKGFVVAQDFPCRPCYLDGCGGSKMSDCLSDIPLDRVLNLL